MDAINSSASQGKKRTLPSPITPNSILTSVEMMLQNIEKQEFGPYLPPNPSPSPLLGHTSNLFGSVGTPSGLQGPPKIDPALKNLLAAANRTTAPYLNAQGNHQALPASPNLTSGANGTPELSQVAESRVQGDENLDAILKDAHATILKIELQKQNSFNPAPRIPIPLALKELLLQKDNANDIPEAIFHTHPNNFHKSIRTRFMQLRGITGYSDGNDRWAELSEENQRIAKKVFKTVKNELYELEKEGRVRRCQKNDLKNEKRRIQRRREAAKKKAARKERTANSCFN